MIAEIMRRHVDPARGMSNPLVNAFCLALRAPSDSPKIYKGVFAADDPLPSGLQHVGTFTAVINLVERKRASDGHFVTIHARPDYILYVDPFGLPCYQRHVRAFLRKCERPVYSNTRGIQAIESNHCGMYAILYVLYFNRPRRNFALKFVKSRAKNDELCAQYLRRLVEA